MNCYFKSLYFFLFLFMFKNMNYISVEVLMELQNFHVYNNLFFRPNKLVEKNHPDNLYTYMKCFTHFRQGSHNRWLLTSINEEMIHRLYKVQLQMQEFFIILYTIFSVLIFLNNKWDKVKKKKGIAHNKYFVFLIIYKIKSVLLVNIFIKYICLCFF